MQSTKTLGQIVDKIVENQPTRLRGARRVRKILGRTDVLQAVARRDDGKRSAFDDETNATARTSAKTFALERSKTSKLKEFERPRASGESVCASSPEDWDSTSEARFGDDARSKTPRRRQIDPTTCERDYSADEVEFMKALDEYKRTSGRMFPTCSEILEVFKSLGYVKIAPTSEKTSAKSVQKTRRATTPAFLNDDEKDDDKIGFDGVGEPLGFV